MASSIIRLDHLAAQMGHVSGGELRRNDHLVPISSLSHPFAQPSFALPILVVAGCINEVTPSVKILRCEVCHQRLELDSLAVEVIENLKSGFLCHGTHEAGAYQYNTVVGTI